MILQMISNKTNAVQTQFESINDQIIIKENVGQKIISGSSQDLLMCLLTNYPLIIDHRYVLVDEIGVLSLMDGVICVYSTYYCKSIYNSAGDQIDITFAHAFPISILPDVRESIIKMLDEVIELKQLVLLPSSSFILADTMNCEKSSEIIFKKYSNLIRKNKQVVIKLTRDLSLLFDDWIMFCSNRFNEKIDYTLIDIFKKIYHDDNVIVKEFWLGDECLCRCLLYYDHENKIIFDIIAPWKPEYKKYSPGIYSLLINTLEAISRGYKYCLCYGDFPYKQKILKYFRKIKLEEL